VAHALAEPMFVLLLVASAVYLLLGDRVEAAFLLASVLVIITITIYQERKTERVVEALRDLSSPRALVVRDGASSTTCARPCPASSPCTFRLRDSVSYLCSWVQGRCSSPRTSCSSNSSDRAWRRRRL
jgi:Ca2+-transporting ATPase